jgi:hypothetical protein
MDHMQDDYRAVTYPGTGLQASAASGAAPAVADPRSALAPVGRTRPAAGGTTALLIADELGWLRRVNASTLADVGRALPVALHRGGPGATERSRFVRWLAPPDGSVLVRIDFPMPGRGVHDRDVTVAVFSDPDDRVGRAFPAPSYPIEAWLSADGRRLVTSSFEPSFLDGEIGASTWHVVDLTDGSLVSAAAFAGYDGERWSWPVLDPRARTAYRLLPLPGVDPVQRGGLRLVAIDIASGAVQATLDLPELRVGRLQLVRGDRIREEIELGPALVPTADGATLAVAHPDGLGVTLLDAATLAVQRRLVQRRSAAPDAASRVDRLERSAWDWPPARTARFGPGGTRLYLAGFGSAPDPADPIASVDHALRVLDLATGVMRRDPAALAVTEMALTSDGSGIFVAGLRPDRWGSPLLGEKAALRRLDPITLATVAERSDVPLDEARLLLPWPA